MKKLYIFNRQDESQSGDFFENEITEDILWSGKDWRHFEKETGLSQAEIGGIVKENGKLLFSIEKKAKYENLKKPIAKGQDLLNYLIRAIKKESAQEGLKAKDKSIKLSKFQDIFKKWKFLDAQLGDIWEYLQIEEEFTKVEFDTFVDSLKQSEGQNNANGKKAIIESVFLLINKWAQSVRFAK